MLNRAAARQQARAKIREAIEGLSRDDRRVVLEDELYLYEAPDAVDLEETPPARRRVQANGSQPREPAQLALSEEVGDDTATTLWKKVFRYCKAHPSSDGKYDFGVVSAALLSHRGTRARTEAYVTIKRKSLQSDRPCREPKFELVDGGQKFRLLNGG